LTVTDGTDTAKLTFNGSYTLANFKLANDGSGGTIVYDPPAPASFSQDTAAPNVTSTGAHCANIALLGSYMASSFAAESDNHGGTMVVAEAPQVGGQPLLSNPHHT
jgi:hypothetical protein